MRLNRFFAVALVGIFCLTIPTFVLGAKRSSTSKDLAPVTLTVQGLAKKQSVLRGLAAVNLSTVSIEVTGSDITTPITAGPTAVSSGQSSVSFALTVLAGADRTFTAKGFDKNGNEQWRGQTTLTVTADIPVTVNLTLRRFDGQTLSLIKIPAANATGVLTTTTVSASFFKEVAASTITTSTLLLKETSSGDTVSGTVFYNPVTQTATFKSTSPLKSGTSYTATLTTAIQEPNGTAAFTVPLSWQFITVGKLFVEDFEPIGSAKTQDGFVVQAISVPGSVDPQVIPDSEGEGGIAINSVISDPDDASPVGVATEMFGIFSGIGVNGTQAAKITANFLNPPSGQTIRASFRLGEASGVSPLLGGGFGTARKIHGGTIPSVPLAGGLVSFFACQMDGTGDHVRFVVIDKDGDRFRSSSLKALPACSAGLEEFAFRVSLGSDGGDLSSIVGTVIPGGVPDGIIDDIIAITLVLVNGDGTTPTNNNPSSAVVDDVMASQAGVSVNSVLTFLNNSITFVDASNTVSVVVTDITSGVATLAGATGLIASSVKVELTLAPVSGFGDITIPVTFTLESENDPLQLSVTLSSLLIGSTGTSVVVAIPPSATVSFSGQDIAGSVVSIPPLTVGSIVTTDGPTLTFDPNALVSALTAAGVSEFDDVLTVGSFDFTAEFGGVGDALVLAPSGPATCTAADGCPTVTKIAGMLTTVPF